MSNQMCFLTLEEVLKLHARSLRDHGGSDGIREPGLVSSALASAENVHHYGQADLFAVAAAYAFHLAESQAFVDGNKRTGTAAALVFLETNGVELPARADDDVYRALIAIAEKNLTKAGLADIFRSWS